MPDTELSTRAASRHVSLVRLVLAACSVALVASCDGVESVPASSIERNSVREVMTDACSGEANCEQAVAKQFDACFDASNYPSLVRMATGDYDREVRRGVVYIMQCIHNEDGEPFEYYREYRPAPSEDVATGG